MERLGNTQAPSIHTGSIMTPRLSVLVASLVLGAACVTLQAAPAPGKALQKIDTKVGLGGMAVTGSTVTVHYTGWLYSPKAPGQHGARFDSTRDAGKPATFKLGAGAVIQGWDEGLRGMKAGGTRTLIVPAAMAFGDSGRGPVPPKANLIFDIELVEVK
jgi:FKBP-type peptidyl-prolyl cis-trans isomerase FkpA